MHGCQCEGIETTFNRRQADKDLKRYRQKGPDATTRFLMDALNVEGVKGPPCSTSAEAWACFRMNCCRRAYRRQSRWTPLQRTLRRQKKKRHAKITPTAFVFIKEISSASPRTCRAQIL